MGIFAARLIALFAAPLCGNLIEPGFRFI